MPDVLEGEYAAYLASFSPNSADAPATLRDSVLGAGQEVPKVFLYLTSDPTPEVHVLHRPTRYAPTLGVTSRWDDQNFCFASDIGAGNQITTVHWPDNAFARTVPVVVPMMADMDHQWTAAAGSDCVGPYAVGTPNTEEIRTRFLVPVPAAYTRLVMAHQVFTPRELWTDLVHLILADGQGAPCAPLIDWARVAATYRQATGADPQDPPASVLPTLRAPVADAGLNRRLWSWITSDLPSLANRTGTTNTLIATTLQAFQNEFAQQRTEAAAARATDKAPKTPTEKFPETVASIRRLCEVGTDTQLPQLWKVLAGSAKAESLSAAQALLDQRADAVGSLGDSPILTPALFERLVGFQLGSADPNDILAGLSIFLTVAGTGEVAQRERARAVVYRQLQSGTAAPSLGDTQQMLDTAPWVTSSTLNFTRTYRAYSILLDVVLGPAHRVAFHFREFFLPHLVQAAPAIEEHYDGLSPLLRAGGFARCLRHTQLKMTTYWNTGPRMGTAAQVPGVEGLLDIAYMQGFDTMLPPIPQRYLQQFQPPPTTPRGTMPAGAGGPPRTGPLSPPGPPTTQSAPGEQVTNVHPDQALMARWTAHNGNLRALTNNANIARPLMDDGSTEVCLAYHLRGSCFSTCGRRSSHGRPLTTTEAQRVAAYLTAHGVATS
jgi:hypothetical protein